MNIIIHISGQFHISGHLVCELYHGVRISEVYIVVKGVDSLEWGLLVDNSPY